MGATEGIAWELLWQLVSIKRAQNKPQSLTDMVNDALPGFLKGSDRKGKSSVSGRQLLQSKRDTSHLPHQHKQPCTHACIG